MNSIYSVEEKKETYILNRLGNLEDNISFIYRGKTYITTCMIEDYYGRYCMEKGSKKVENLSIFNMVYEIRKNKK